MMEPELKFEPINFKKMEQKEEKFQYDRDKARFKVFKVFPIALKWQNQYSNRAPREGAGTRPLIQILGNYYLEYVNTINMKCKL